MNIPNEESLTHLLQATLARYLSAEARIEQILSSPITPGLSGAKIQRHQLTLQTPEGQRQTSLVTKEARLLERRILTQLNQQQQRAVPFSHTFDLITDAPTLVCLQDLGTEPRPDATGSFPLNLLMQEAQGLASIHAVNLGQTEALAWLPHADRSYVTTYIQQRFWRPAWEQVVHDPAFVELFGAVIPQVEAAAATIAEEMDALYREGDTLTLVHSDLNPSNVMVCEHMPYFIDWEIPRYGPLYLDIPHLFPTLERAEYYQRALSEAGTEIALGDFAERYRIAARFVGLRYLWRPLKAWREDHTKTKWVDHYLSMILQ
ncbi:MAG: phosphotransferase [Ktedonobacteraceae bacterium]